MLLVMKVNVWPEVKHDVACCDNQQQSRRAQPYGSARLPIISTRSLYTGDSFTIAFLI